MTDPRTVLGQARQGPVPVHWRVFTKKRGKLSGFLRGSSHDPDPLLVITPDGAIEYVNERKPLTAVNFDDLTGITLQVHGQSFSDSTSVTLQVDRPSPPRRQKDEVAIHLLCGQPAGSSVLYRSVRRPQDTSRKLGYLPLKKS
jgi:hypothetical protein